MQADKYLCMIKYPYGRSTAACCKGGFEGFKRYTHGDRHNLRGTWPALYEYICSVYCGPNVPAPYFRSVNHFVTVTQMIFHFGWSALICTSPFLFCHKPITSPLPSSTNVQYFMGAIILPHIRSAGYLPTQRRIFQDFINCIQRVIIPQRGFKFSSAIEARISAP